MKVYVDILIALNTLVTYFMLLGVKMLSGVKSRLRKLIIASLIGGVSSLYILLPQQSFLIEITVKLIVSIVLALVGYYINSFKILLRTVIYLFSVSFSYAGLMIAFFYALKPNGMIINNGVVYFSVSPLMIIFSSVLCYFVLLLLKRFLRREDVNSKYVDIEFSLNDKIVCCRCLIDSGCAVNDAYGGKKVAIINKTAAYDLFGIETVDTAVKLQVSSDSKYRLIPYKTLSSKGIMPAFLIDFARVDNTIIKKVLLCVSNITFDGDFDGIISPQFLL